MELLCLDQFSTLGGGQHCFLDLVPSFRNRDWTVRMLLPDDGPFEDRLRRLGCEVQTFTVPELSNRHKSISELSKYPFAMRSAIRGLSRELRVMKPDILYVNGPRFLPAAAWVARQYRIPLLFHAHSRLLQKAALIATGCALAASRASVIACCDYVAAPLARYVPPQKLRVIYNGMGNLRPLNSAASSGIQNIGVVGRMAPEKGQLEFVRAAHLLSQVFPSVRFHVIGAPRSITGNSYYSDVLRASQGLHISFEKWKDDPVPAMKSLDLLVVPSQRHDAAPRVVLEALSAGIPVVAFPSGGIPELIEDNATGFLVKEHTAASLASRIADVLRMDGHGLDRVIAAARNAWSARFQIDSYRHSVCETVLSTARALPVLAFA